MSMNAAWLAVPMRQDKTRRECGMQLVRCHFRRGSEAIIEDKTVVVRLPSRRGTFVSWSGRTGLASVVRGSAFLRRLTN